jgi:hypothetical protein
MPFDTTVGGCIRWVYTLYVTVTLRVQQPREETPVTNGGRHVQEAAKKAAAKKGKGAKAKGAVSVKAKKWVPTGLEKKG